MRCRKNYRDLTNDERDHFVKALFYLKSTGVVDQFAKEHSDNFDNGIHMTSHFLPWHRDFLRRFEDALRTFHPDITIPYWNSTVDTSSSDPLWDNAFLGQFDAAWRLRRVLGSTTLPTPQQVQDTLNNDKTYDVFWMDLETIIHNPPHVWVGGVMGTRASPGDPVFYLHHCWIDLLWAQWQLLYPGAAFVSSSTTDCDHHGCGLNDPMPTVNITPAAVLDHRGINLYDYPTGFQQETLITFIIMRDPIGQDEIDALLKTGSTVVPNAVWINVDGFTADDLKVHSYADTLATLPTLTPSAGITIRPHPYNPNTSDKANQPANNDYGPEIQRFTFYFDLDFGSDPDHTAFNFTTDTETLTLNVAIQCVPVPGSAQITLIKQPDPFILHGDPTWLSIDLRVFVVRPGDTWFKIQIPTGFNASAAPGFIQQAIAALNQPNSTVRGDFDNLPTDESAKLFVHPTDGPTGPLVFNFALAKVHYIGLISAATNVRVFFRLFNAQTTSSAFDYPPGAQYRRATSNSNPSNPQPIPLAGFQGSDYVTIPCFANGRIDSTVSGMDKQTDDYNIQSFPATGAEVDMYFGCWLDINQLSPNVLPKQVPPPPNQDGPFDPRDPNPDFRPLPVQSAILKNLHQCLIAEIAFDPTPIPIGKDTSNWDKLAQRNLAWSDVGSAQALTTFEIRPTPSGLPADQMPDELIIDWGNTPSGSSVQIYLPAVNVADILAMAARMYTSHRLVRVDDHTLKCSTGGITYVPIPPGLGINYVGLLSVDVPATMQNGQVFNIIVRQVTNAFGTLTPPPPPPPSITARARSHSTAMVAVEPSESEIEWRSILGAFQLTIPVKTKEVLLGREEQDLSVLRWIQKAIPTTSRWSPAFQRYVNGIADRVRAFGGNPDNITPSPTGTVTFGNIYGTNFDDKNRNGKRDVGEEGLPGWNIRLVGVDTITMKPVNREEVTDANGNYAFMNVNPGIYQVFELFDASKAKAGWVPTTPVTVPVNLKAGETINVNFGNRKIP